MKGKELRETVGLIAVVAGLFFVGWEIRQNNNLARAAAYQAIGIASAAAWDTQAHDREFQLATMGKAPEDMTEADWRQRAAKFTVFARLGEMVLTQVRLDLLPEDSMNDFGFVGWQGIFDKPTEACLWPMIRSGVSPEFRAWVEDGKDMDTIDCSQYALPEDGVL